MKKKITMRPYFGKPFFCTRDLLKGFDVILLHEYYVHISTFTPVINAFHYVPHTAVTVYIYIYITNLFYSLFSQWFF